MRSQLIPNSRATRAAAYNDRISTRPQTGADIGVKRAKSRTPHQCRARSDYPKIKRETKRMPVVPQNGNHLTANERGKSGSQQHTAEHTFRRLHMLPCVQTAVGIEQPPRYPAESEHDEVPNRDPQREHCEHVVR